MLGGIELRSLVKRQKEWNRTMITSLMRVMNNSHGHVVHVGNRHKVMASGLHPFITSAHHRHQIAH